MKRLPEPPTGMRWLRRTEVIRRGDRYVVMRTEPVHTSDCKTVACAPFWDGDRVSHFARPLPKRDINALVEEGARRINARVNFEIGLNDPVSEEERNYARMVLRAAGIPAYAPRRKKAVKK